MDDFWLWLLNIDEIIKLEPQIIKRKRFGLIRNIDKDRSEAFASQLNAIRPPESV
ncbi:hypothetical protein OK016_08515 [Vibrio chagasii]|nr:hypothetical protein [Vibrio chagasii]